MKNRKLLTFFSVMIISLTISSVLSSFAWLMDGTGIGNVENIGGSFLQSYFHCGDGSKTYEYNEDGSVKKGPFTITTPRHFENLYKLHYLMPENDFAKKGYYFALGFDFNLKDETEEHKFYKTNENGAVDTNNYSDTLNLGNMELPPLGTPNRPFNGHFIGNNLTVKNFTIKSEVSLTEAINDKTETKTVKTSDLGVFGFVSTPYDESNPVATITNAYFSDFTIDTTNADSNAIKHGTEGVIHDSSTGDGNIHMGYIAGHIVDTRVFNNVFVNNCSLVGNSPSSKGIDNYGYFGKVEVDSYGGDLGKGNDYSFTLNSQAVFNYFDQNHERIKNQQLVLRNTSETSSMEEDENGDKVKRINKSNGTIEPFSTAITTDSAAGSTTYLINNGYSLSTSGYATPEYKEVTRTYNTYYKDREYLAEDKTNHSHNGQIKVPEQAPGYVENSMINSGEGLIVDTSTGDEMPTSYYYKNSTTGKFMYGESYDRQVIEGYDAYDFDIVCNIPDFYTEERKLIAPSLTIDARLYMDNQTSGGNNYIPINVTYTSSRNGSLGWGGYIYKCVFTVSPITLHLQEGYHNFSIYISYTYNAWGTDYTVAYVYGNYNSSQNKLDQTEILINTEGQGITIPSSGTNFEKITQAIPSENFIVHEFVFDTTRLTPHIDKRSFETELLFKEVVNGVESSEFSDVVQTNVSRSNFLYTAAFNGKSANWKMTVTNIEAIQGASNSNYFLGEETLIVDSGYKRKNIDVVGGGVEFYYQNILGTEIAIIGINSEKTAGEKLKTPSSKGTHFYADDMCPSSIVIYLKNTSNALDGRNDQLGKISFTYVQASILGYSIDIVEPSFKKGDAFLSLKNAGTNIVESEDTGLLNLTHTISLDLTEEDVQKVSYCALDKNGNILGRFDKDGTTTMSNSDIAKIDTYILVLGGQSDNSYDTWVTNIDFTYKAEDGFGGTFGSIGYRSANQNPTEETINGQSNPNYLNSTILNFYFINEENNYYKVKVSYAYDSKQQKGVYSIEFESTKQITVSIYNYKQESFIIIFNNVEISGSSSVQTVGPTNSSA